MAVAVTAMQQNQSQDSCNVTTDATFSSKPITGTALHHQIANNYRQLPAHYGSLKQIIGIFMAFIIKDAYRYRRFTDKVGQFTTGYHRK